MSEIWTMRDGTKIAIKDMTTNHIINTMKMLERNAIHIKINQGRKMLSIVSGEMASLAAEGAVDEMYDMDDITFLRKYTAYSSLEKELSNRCVTI